MAEQPTAEQQTVEQQKSNKGLWNKLSASISSKDLIMGIGLLIVAGILLGVFFGGGKFLILLKDSEVSRGLITFVVALTTVLLAIILTLYIITADQSENVKERFSYGKEILTTLVGILGTVLGFYFGSAERSLTGQPTLAAIHFQGPRLMTHVSGGTPPYRYSMTSTAKSFPKIENRLSKDGWIVETLNTQLPGGTTIGVHVSDAKDKSISVEAKVPEEPSTEKPAAPDQNAKPPAQPPAPAVQKP